MVGYTNNFFILYEFHGVSISMFLYFPLIWSFLLISGEDAEYKLLPGDSNAAEKEEVEPSEPVVTCLRS